MTCSSYCIVALLSMLEPADPGEDLIDTLSEREALATLSEQWYTRAVEYADKGQYHDASKYIVKAYGALSGEKRVDGSALGLLIEAADYHLKAFRHTNDAALLAEIQPLLEQFLERYEGADPRSAELGQKLDSIRELRLTISQRYLDENKYAKAAIEADDCYRALRDSDKARFIGERVALAASRAHRQAWYLDGDIEHIEAASKVIEDHLARAGEGASVTMKGEHRQLKRDLALTRARDDRSDRTSHGGSTPRARSYLIASGAALSGGIVLSAGASAVGARSFAPDVSRTDGSETSFVAQPGPMTTAIPLALAGGVVSGLAIYSMGDSGFIPPRARKILAAGALAAGIVGVAAGSSLLAVGAAREGELGDRAEGFQNGGFSILMGMGAPLGAGIAALVSRRAGGR
jgi:hypothetical protein